MAEPLKFIHAADFHLDEPYRGVAELPPHVRSTLVDAPYLAAERIFEKAVAEQVDFVILSGDIANLDDCGPRTFSFLLEQFKRLSAKNIAVYWVGGSIDQPDRWPNAVRLPANVQTFSSPMVEEIVHLKSSNLRPIATIYAAGYESRKRRISEFSADANAPFNIAIAYGELESEDLTNSNIRYWALGGKHNTTKSVTSGKHIVYPGTSQSRSPIESGPFGCVMVTVDSAGSTLAQDLYTDSVRYQKQKITLPNDLSKEEIKNQFGDIGLNIVSESNEQVVLVDWILNAPSELNARIQQNGWLEEIENWLQTEFGQSRPGFWTLDIKTGSSSLPKSLYEEDTILGDFLRNLRKMQMESDAPLNLNQYFGETTNNDVMLAALQVSENRRNEILDEAALLGVEVLTGTEKA